MTKFEDPNADNWRNRIVHRVVNFVFLFATPEYKRFMDGAIQYGLSSAVRDEEEGREAPEPWQDVAERKKAEKPVQDTRYKVGDRVMTSTYWAKEKKGTVMEVLDVEIYQSPYHVKLDSPDYWNTSKDYFSEDQLSALTEE